MVYLKLLNLFSVNSLFDGEEQLELGKETVDYLNELSRAIVYCLLSSNGRREMIEFNDEQSSKSSKQHSSTSALTR